MKTQFELANDLIENYKCPQCGIAVNLLQHSESTWAVECSDIDLKDEDDETVCNDMIVDNTMQGVYDKFVNGNTPEPADSTP